MKNSYDDVKHIIENDLSLNKELIISLIKDEIKIAVERYFSTRISKHLISYRVTNKINESIRYLYRTKQFNKLVADKVLNNINI